MTSSRRRVSPGTICYLCGLEIAPDQGWNRDHVPPLRFFAKSVRKTHYPQLACLPTHTNCNSSYREDEEYFCVAFAPQTMGSSIQRGTASPSHRLGCGTRPWRRLVSVASSTWVERAEAFCRHLHWVSRWKCQLAADQGAASKAHSVSSISFLRKRLRASACFARRLSPGFK